MWNLIIQMEGEQPSESEVEKLEEKVSDLLDADDFDYLDVTSG